MLDRSQIEAYTETSNADPLEVWRIVAYHELGHHKGCLTEESCWDWLECQSNLDQATVRVLRSQATCGSLWGLKGRNWELVKRSLNSKPIEQFIQLNQFSTIGKQALGLETPGQAWHWIKFRYRDSFDLKNIVEPLFPNSRGYLMELCYSQRYDPLETEIAGLLLWREIASLL